MPKNYYSILGVSRSAKPETIHSAFRALARRYHPDTANAASPGKFGEVVEAYNALRDPAQRRQHDVDLDLETKNMQRIAEPLFSPIFVTPNTVRRYSNANFDDLFAQMTRLMEAELELPFEFF